MAVIQLNISIKCHWKSTTTQRDVRCCRESAMHLGPSRGPDPRNRDRFRVRDYDIFNFWRNGRSPRSSHFPRKAILNSVQITEQLLVSHASKILLRIILERIRVKTETEIADEQAGFRQGRGTRDQIMNLRILMHKACEHQQPLYMCFVDFKKAFDSISNDKLWVTMMDMGYPLHLIDLLAKQNR